MSDGRDLRIRRVRRGVEQSVKAIALVSKQAERVGEISSLLIRALRNGGKLLIAGNGGSAAEAMHMAEELIGRFRTDRAPLPAVALAADGTALTCIANDFGFDQVFSRQVTALGKPGDILVLFSTSGNSRNLLLALEAARFRKMKSVCLLGRDGGQLRGKGTLELVLGVQATARIQEAHQAIMHLLLEEIEEEFGARRT